MGRHCFLNHSSGRNRVVRVVHLADFIDVWGLNAKSEGTQMTKALNEKQRRALERYKKAGTAKYPCELDVRASTARALCRRGFLREVFDRALIFDWSKYIVTTAGKA